MKMGWFGGTTIFGNIHIFIYMFHKNQPNVGKYTSPMDPMGPMGMYNPLYSWIPYISPILLNSSNSFQASCALPPIIWWVFIGKWEDFNLYKQNLPNIPSVSIS